MTGTAKKIIDKIIDQKSGGNKTIRMTLETKLILKGFHPGKFDASTPDDPPTIQKLQSLAAELGVKI